MNKLPRTPRQIVLDMHRAAGLSENPDDWRRDEKVWQLGQRQLRRTNQEITTVTVDGLLAHGIRLLLDPRDPEHRWSWDSRVADLPGDESWL